MQSWRGWRWWRRPERIALRLSESGSDTWEIICRPFRGSRPDGRGSIWLWRSTLLVEWYGRWRWRRDTQERSLDGTYTRLLRKALNISYKDHIPNIILYGSLPPTSSTLRSRRLQFAGHCFRRVEEPIHSVLFFEPADTFRPGGHVRTNYVKTLLRDSGLSTISDLSQAMASRNEWRDKPICNVAGVDVDASTVST